MSFKIDHLLSESHKVTICNTDAELIEFVQKICVENEDTEHFAIHTAEDAVDYIELYCDNLKITC